MQMFVLSKFVLQDDEKKPNENEHDVQTNTRHDTNLQTQERQSEQRGVSEQREDAFLLHSKNNNQKRSASNRKEILSQISSEKAVRNSPHVRKLSLDTKPQNSDRVQRNSTHARKLSLDNRPRFPLPSTRTATSDTERTDESSTSSRQLNSNRSWLSSDSERQTHDDNDLATSGRGSTVTSSSRQSTWRKPIIKSEKPATKPLLLGEIDFLHLMIFS